MCNTNDQRSSKNKPRPFRSGFSKIIYLEDDPSFCGRIRKHLRNPPMRTVVSIVFVIFAVPVLLAYPRVSGVAKENWGNVQQARERHFVNVTAASWIYPFLRRHAHRMQTAQFPNEWRSISFKHGPCLPSHMDQLPTGKYSYAVEQACISLDKIQANYAGYCYTVSTCDIPGEAVEALQVVLDRLRFAFSDANLAPLVTDEQGQNRYD